MQSRPVPLWALVHLTHAVLQDAASAAGADILHIKGPTVDVQLRPGVHHSGDADVLVRPAHLDRFLAELERRGWSMTTSFDEGSSFSHAANYVHGSLAPADLHRELPGPHASPEVVFDALWRGRVTRPIAHTDCAVPGLSGQVFVQTLHAARSHGAEPAMTWEHADDALRAQVRALAARLDCEVALAAGIGELDAFASARDHDLWAYWSAPGLAGDRVGEWRGRLRAASGFRERVRLLVRMARVNRTHLAMRLGHEPSRAEVRAEQRARVRRLWEGLRGR